MNLEDLKKELRPNDIIHLHVLDHFSDYELILLPAYISIIGRVLILFNEFIFLEIWNAFYHGDGGTEQIFTPFFVVLAPALIFLQIFDDLE